MSNESVSAARKSSGVLVILGSTRAGRLCPTIGAWVAGIGRSCSPHDFDIIDLRDWHLPWDDEPGIPALGDYEKEHTKAWSEKVAGAAAIVIVTPQYNWGYPAPLKNALDHLYREWKNKPLVIISYGGHGGGKCAAQLLQVAGALHMRPVATMPAIELSDAMIRGGAAVDPHKDFSVHLDTVREAFSQLTALMVDVRSDLESDHGRRPSYLWVSGRAGDAQWCAFCGRRVAPSGVRFRDVDLSVACR